MEPGQWLVKSDLDNPIFRETLKAGQKIILVFNLSPCREGCVISFEWFPGVWDLYVDVSEHSVRSIHDL
jgi:hypothetical protein